MPLLHLPLHVTLFCCHPRWLQNWGGSSILHEASWCFSSHLPDFLIYVTSATYSPGHSLSRITTQTAASSLSSFNAQLFPLTYSLIFAVPHSSFILNSTCHLVCPSIPPIWQILTLYEASHILCCGYTWIALVVLEASRDCVHGDPKSHCRKL